MNIRIPFHTISSKARLHILNAFVMALFFCTSAWTADITSQTLTILHTNDFHAHLQPSSDGKGGAAAIAAYVHSVRASVPNVLVLDAGDMTQGSPVSSVFLGRPIYEIMSAVGYDAGTLGNHEFDNGAKMIAEFCSLARFQLLSSNITLRGKPVTGKPTAVITVGGLRVGLLALTTSEGVDLDVNPGLEIESPEATVKRLAPELKKRSDLIIALSHLGDEVDAKLAAATSGTLAVIVGGHSHTALQKPVKVGSTLIVQAGCWGQYVGRLDLKLDPQTHAIVNYDGRLIPMPAPRLAPDPVVAGLVAKWEDKVTSQMDVKIGRNPVAMSTDEVSRALERTWRAACHADFAYQNPGGTRGKLAAGPIMVRDIWTILPFNNTLQVLTLDKAQVKAVLGPEVTFEGEKPFYTLVTSNYAAAGIIKSLKLGEDRVKTLPGSYRDPIIRYIREHGNFASQTKGRAAKRAPRKGAAVTR